MKLRNYLAAAAMTLCSFASSAYTEFNSYGTDVISDLALIYAGADTRPEWNVEEVMPYVVHTYADGHKDWFFDGFLILEFTQGSSGKGFQNGVGTSYATKEDWEELLDKHISALRSIDTAISIGKAELGEPRLRHKAVLGMPAPIKAQGTGWGELNGRTLDFTKDDDRFEASKWYVVEAIKRFNDAKLENVDLSGLYWVEEGLYTNGSIVPRVNDWIYRNCMRSYWIPYYANNEQFKLNWHDLYNFDITYLQPNYFFRRSVPLQQLYDACDEAKRYGMGLEMEFETQGTSRLQHDDPDSYFTRLEDYIRVFEEKGVYDESAVAWYSGTKGFLDLDRSSDKHNHAIADRMADIVARRQQAKADSLAYPTNAIRDLALIWQGASYRIDWNEEDFRPYVAHKFADGTTDWLFDGFLFLDGCTTPDIRFIPWAGFEGAKKEDWQWYLDRLFEPGKGIEALNKSIGTLKKEIGEPDFRHKVVLTLLVPVCGNKHWGELDGRALDFDNDDDRVAAAKWYLDQMLARYEAGNYENLDLHGIYWLDEDLIHTKDFPKLIAPYIHEKGLEFSWIPYFKGRGYERWRDVGFDIAYMQPGHFFEWEKPEKRLDEACDLSLLHGMGLEFECDSEALSQFPGSKMARMQSYIDAFKRNGVWETSPVAWYTGSKAFIDMFRQPSRENQAMMDQVARIIVERRSKPQIVKK